MGEVLNGQKIVHVVRAKVYLFTLPRELGTEDLGSCLYRFVVSVLEGWWMAQDGV